jgi:adenosylhomocysteine nucleosidase
VAALALTRHDARMVSERNALVGLLAPMPSEMKPLAKACALQPDPRKEWYRGGVGAVKLVATKTGMGTKHSREATERLLETNDVQHVIVCGIAGGMGASRVGDVLYPEIVVDKATRTEYKAAPLPNSTPSGRLVTHDDFDMGPDEHAALIDEGFIAVDMETAAIAAVCVERGVPWSAVRVISDLVGVTPGDVIDLANPDGSPRIAAGLKYLVTHPNRIPKLMRLAKESTAAANAAARATRAALDGFEG